MGGSCGDPSSRSSKCVTGRPASEVGGSARSRSIAPAITRGSVTRTDSWSVACSPCSRARSSSRSSSVRPSALQRAPRARRRAAPRDAVLVPDDVPGRRSSRAPPRSRTRGRATRRDPLEAGEGLLVPGAVRGGDRAQQRGRHDRAASAVPAPGRGAAGDRRAARRPRRRAASASRRRASGTATAHRSASGSLASTTSAPGSAAAASARSMAPGSSGFGNATVGKSGSGSACAATTCGVGEAGAAQRREQVSPPTPCIGV